MSKYTVLFRDGKHITIRTEGDAKAPKWVRTASEVRIDNLPEGYSIDAREVVAIYPDVSGGAKVSTF